MTKSAISDYKMLEATPYELPDPKLTTQLIIGGYKGLEKTYGPVYTTNLIKHTLIYVKDKFGEEPPKDMKTLDQLMEYLCSLGDKHPNAYCAVGFAQFNVENLLEGKIGAQSRQMGWGFAKDVKKGNFKDKNIDIDGLVFNLRHEIVPTGMAPHEMGYRKNGDESVDLIYPKCYLYDACKPAFDEGLAEKHGGRVYCGFMLYNCQWLQMKTGENWDYELTEYFAPCVGRCYMF